MSDSVRQVCLDLTSDLVEGRFVGHREIRENLAVDVDVRALEARHERAVAHAELSHCGVDARDPQRAERALLVAAVAVGVLPRLHHRLLCFAKEVFSAAPATPGLLADLLFVRPPPHSTLCSFLWALPTTSTA